MKGQSLIVQFLLFFMIGLGLFAIIGGLFRVQSDIIRTDIAESNRELVSSYISSIAISMATSCKGCDLVSYYPTIGKTTANYFTILSLSPAGLQISSEPEGGSISTASHNLLQQFNLRGTASSVKPISIVLDDRFNLGDFSIANDRILLFASINPLPADDITESEIRAEASEDANDILITFASNRPDDTITPQECTTTDGSCTVRIKSSSPGISKITASAEVYTEGIMNIIFE